MSGGAVSGNSGGGVYVTSSGTFAMSGGAVSGNTSPSTGGWVFVDGPFTMSGGAVSGNTSYLGGVYVTSSGTFAMSGGAVSGNTTLSGDGYGREVFVIGTFKISGQARPERVMLYSSTITISGLLSGPVVPIDLVISLGTPLAGYVNTPILKLDDSYSGDLAALKAFFSLGNSKNLSSPSTETPITGYRISDQGLFVAE
jgi:hypothetical protein